MANLCILYIQKCQGDSKVHLCDTVKKISALEKVNGCIMSPGYMCGATSIFPNKSVDDIFSAVFKDNEKTLIQEFGLLNTMCDGKKDGYLTNVQKLGFNTLNLNVRENAPDHRKMAFLYRGTVFSDGDTINKSNFRTSLLGKVTVRAIVIGSSNFSASTYLHARKGEADIILFKSDDDEILDIALRQELNLPDTETVDLYRYDALLDERVIPNRDVVFLQSRYHIGDDYLQGIFETTLNKVLA